MHWVLKFRLWIDIWIIYNMILISIPTLTTSKTSFILLLRDSKVILEAPVCLCFDPFVLCTNPNTGSSNIFTIAYPSLRQAQASQEICKDKCRSGNYNFIGFPTLFLFSSQGCIIDCNFQITFKLITRRRLKTRLGVGISQIFQ